MNERDQAFLDALMKICAEFLVPLKAMVENNSRLASTNEALATEVLRCSRRNESAH